MRVVLLAAISCIGAAEAFLAPPALFGAAARLPPGVKSLRSSGHSGGLHASVNRDKENAGELSRRSALALIGLLPSCAFAADTAEQVSSPKNDPYYKNLVESQDPSSERKRLQKGMANPGATRKKIEVPKALRKKGALEAPDISFPSSMKDLDEYTQTKSGLYFQELKQGDGSRLPKKGDIVELHYVAAVCVADEEGNYEVAEREGEPEIYPNLPQGIIRESPRFDSSYDRGRTMKARFGKAQLAGGLEEAIADMSPGGAKMVFLIPELAYACPAGKVCFPDIEADERIAFYVEVVSVGKSGEGGG